MLNLPDRCAIVNRHLGHIRLRNNLALQKIVTGLANKLLKSGQRLIAADSTVAIDYDRDNMICCFNTNKVTYNRFADCRIGRNLSLLVVQSLLKAVFVLPVERISTILGIICHSWNFTYTIKVYNRWI